mmetsp:Transcript_36000/g.52765  ORF Transcript_36000/g.52765 Transcript_36000/m.52765 type:complete len:233 (+) Transcript_36000:866-1564(+)
MMRSCTLPSSNLAYSLWSIRRKRLDGRSRVWNLSARNRKCSFGSSRRNFDTADGRILPLVCWNVVVRFAFAFLFLFLRAVRLYSRNGIMFGFAPSWLGSTTISSAKAIATGRSLFSFGSSTLSSTLPFVSVRVAPVTPCSMYPWRLYHCFNNRAVRATFSFSNFCPSNPPRLADWVTVWGGNSVLDFDADTEVMIVFWSLVMPSFDSSSSNDDDDDDDDDDGLKEGKRGDIV